MAKNHLDVGVTQDGQGNVAFLSRGYPLFLAAIFALTGPSIATAQIANASLSVLSVYLVYANGRQLKLSHGQALCAASLWACYPPALLYPEYLAKENLLIPLLLLQIRLCFAIFQGERKLIASLLAGVVFALGYLTSPSILFTAFVIIGAVFWVQASLGYRFFLLLSFSVACASILYPQALHLEPHLGTKALSSNGGFNLYLGNNPAASVRFQGIENTAMAEEWNPLRKSRGEAIASDVLKEEAFAYMAEHPLHTFIMSVKKAAYFWIPPIHEGKGPQSGFEKALRLVWLIYYSVLLFGLMLFLSQWRHFRRTEWMLFAFILSYAAIYAAFFIIFRFRLPVMPFVILAGVQGYVFWLTSRKWTWKPVAPA